MQLPFTARGVTIVALQAALIIALVGAGWIVHRQLPTRAGAQYNGPTTTLQIVLRQPPDSYVSGLDVAVNFYQVDIVVRKHGLQNPIDTMSVWIYSPESASTPFNRSPFGNQRR